MAHSAIVIPVVALEPVVRPRLVRTLPQYLFDDPEATHAHITLLGPFIDRDQVDDALLDRLNLFFRSVAPFTFSLSSLRTFADGSVYLEPDPSAPFICLTRALWRDYPDYPPYGDAFRELIPHLTLEYRSDATTMDDLTAQLRPLLPVHATADIAWFAWYEPSRSQVVARFGFEG